MMPELHPAANRRADALIAVSASTKSDAVRVLGLRPEKISVIHSGIAAPFFDPDAKATDSVRARYGLNRIAGQVGGSGVDWGGGSAGSSKIWLSAGGG
jgi:hypothetical protein